MNNFKCKIFTDKEYVCLVLLSEIEWRRELFKKAYNIKKHQEWADKDNYGVTHFGINKNNIKILNIRFDILHLKLSITQKSIKFICKLLSKYLFEVQQKYIDEVLNKDDN